MNFLSKLGRGIGRFFGVVGDVDKVLRAFSPEAKMAAVRTFSDVLQFVAAVEAAGAEKGANFALDGAVLTYAKQLYTDAVSDVAEAKQIFEALGLKLPAAPAPAKAA